MDKKPDSKCVRCIHCGGHIRLATSKRLWWIDGKGWICSKACRKQYEAKQRAEEAKKTEASNNAESLVMRSGG